MSPSEQLTELVETQSIDIINVVAVPRSMSTMLGRSLCQGTESTIFVNEPFNRNNLDLEAASQSILDPVEKYLEEGGSKPTIVTKNMSTYLTDQAFAYLCNVSGATIWSVREPLVQIGSLLTRILNDMHIETGASAINQDRMLEHIEAVCIQLQHGALSTNFSRTGWESIINHFRSLDEHKPDEVVDGAQLTRAPEQVLTSLCTATGIAYSPLMVRGWTKSYVNVNTGSSRFSTADNAWTKEAATSTEIAKNDRTPLDLATLPPALKIHILQTAIPAYREMLGAQ